MKNTEAGVFSKNYKSTVAGVSLEYLTIITILSDFSMVKSSIKSISLSKLF